jgi:hypothetical protein
LSATCASTSSSPSAWPTATSSDRVASRLATGYVLGPGGARPIPDREWVGAGAGGIYSTPRDMARYVAALLGGGANEHGRVLGPRAIAAMFEPHYQPDPRVPGVGLAFFRSDAGWHLTAEHEGILPGFNSALVLAPNDGLGLIAFTNGSSGAMGWLPFELRRLLRHLLNVPDEAARGDVPHHPEIWGELCGRYRLPQRVSDLRGRAMMGGGDQVFVRGGRLMLRVLTPVPAVYEGLPLHPDNDTDPYMFRLDLSQFGMAAVRLVFSHEVGGGVTAVHTDLGSQPVSLYKQPQVKNPQLWITGALGALAVVAMVKAVQRSRRRPHQEMG